mmetsp:Transcript_6048/g.24000  ORF Transcript_6048/g.24000 Transcript_6048/m.24000 type:complete len:245 (-) Transcript_6048:1642-2376(-)
METKRKRSRIARGVVGVEPRRGAMRAARPPPTCAQSMRVSRSNMATAERTWWCMQAVSPASISVLGSPTGMAASPRCICETRRCSRRRHPTAATPLCTKPSIRPTSQRRPSPPSVKTRAEFVRPWRHAFIAARRGLFASPSPCTATSVAFVKRCTSTRAHSMATCTRAPAASSASRYHSTALVAWPARPCAIARVKSFAMTFPACARLPKRVANLDTSQSSLRREARSRRSKAKQRRMITSSKE